MSTQRYGESDDPRDLWQGRITSDPDVMLGKPCVMGTRITVELILEGLASGGSIEDLLSAHPRLTRDDIHAALGYGLDLVRRQLRVPASGRAE